MTQSVTTEVSSLVAQAVTRREAAFARVTSPGLLSETQRRKLSSEGEQPPFQKQLRIKLRVKKSGSITLRRRFLRVS